MIIINESTILAREFDISLPINIISTCGFLYDYLVENDKVIYFEKNQNLIHFLKSLENELIIIATDLDNAGELIAMELLSTLNNNNNIYRLNISFEELLSMKELNETNIKEHCTKNLDLAKINHFLLNKTLENKQKRLGAIKYLINNNIKNIEI